MCLASDLSSGSVYFIWNIASLELGLRCLLTHEKSNSVTYEVKQQLTSVYRADDKALDDCSDQPKSQLTTIKPAQVIAMPLLQHFPTCMSCGRGNVTPTTHKTIGTCDLCGIYQHLQYCHNHTMAKITFAIEDTTVTRLGCHGQGVMLALYMIIKLSTFYLS